MTQCAFGPGFLINFITEELMHCFPTDALGYQRTCTAGLRPLLSPTRCWAYFGKQKALPTVLSLRGKPTFAPLSPHILGIQRGVPNPSPRELLALTACLAFGNQKPPRSQLQQIHSRARLSPSFPSLNLFYRYPSLHLAELIRDTFTLCGSGVKLSKKF